MWCRDSSFANNSNRHEFWKWIETISTGFFVCFIPFLNCIFATNTRNSYWKSLKNTFCMVLWARNRFVGIKIIIFMWTVFRFVFFHIVAYQRMLGNENCVFKVVVCHIFQVKALCPYLLDIGFKWNVPDEIFNHYNSKKNGWLDRLHLPAPIHKSSNKNQLYFHVCVF